MPGLQDEIRAYDALAGALEAEGHLGEWALVHGGSLQGLFATFEGAAAEAVSKFGRGPYLIRQIGVEQVTLPASVMFQPFYEVDTRRL